MWRLRLLSVFIGVLTVANASGQVNEVVEGDPDYFLEQNGYSFFKDVPSDGIWKIFYARKRDQVKLILNYKDGTLVNKAFTYYQSGSLMTEADYENNTVSHWSEGGKLLAKGSFKGPYITGTWTFKDIRGRDLTSIDFGKKECFTIRLLPSGRLKSINYEGPSCEGPGISWYENGQVSWIGSFKETVDGLKQDGYATEWTSLGDTLRSILYFNDKVVIKSEGEKPKTTVVTAECILRQNYSDGSVLQNLRFTEPGVVELVKYNVDGSIAEVTSYKQVDLLQGNSEKILFYSNMSNQFCCGHYFRFADTVYMAQSRKAWYTYPNEPRAVTEYQHGSLNYATTIWYPMNIKWNESVYFNGLKQGKHRYWDIKGRLTREETWKQGKLVNQNSF